METRTITVQAYRDPDGHPTCRAHRYGAFCLFLTSRKYGLIDVCGVTGKDIQRGPADMQRGEFADEPHKHYMRPVSGCPVWREEWRRYDGEPEADGAPDACDPRELGRAIDMAVQWIEEAVAAREAT